LSIIRTILVAASVGAMAVVGTGLTWHEEPTVAALEEQLQGRHCQFQFQDYKGCYAAPMPSVWERQRNPAQLCDIAAIKCLGHLHSAAAITALTRLLETKADVETCDGVLPVRTTAVKVLAASGQAAAIEPLRRLLTAQRKMMLSGGAAGCVAPREPAKPIIEAIAKLERQIGYWPDLD
jgi:hypothetical protein